LFAAKEIHKGRDHETTPFHETPLNKDKDIGVQCTTCIHRSTSLTKYYNHSFNFGGLKLYLVHYLPPNLNQLMLICDIESKSKACICIQGHSGCVFEPRSAITLIYSTNSKRALEE
jgi:hypothetical protein